jgi:beta-lactamase regulating signal transducer with metallopeptidase domain
MDPLARWMLTYLLHSTALLGAAWLVRLALGERRLAVQEAVLRAALVGGLVTASLQIGLDVRPIGGAFTVSAAPAALAVTPASAPIAGSGGLESLPPSSWRRGPVVAPTLAARAAAAVAAVTPRWRTGLAALWAALAAVALTRLVVAALRLRRLLRCRRPIRPGELAPGAATAARALGLRRPVLLSEAPRLSVPLATGVLRPEVCLPTRALGELGAEEQVALCAHELAHLARHDPAWVLLARLVEALAPLQPLNAWARRRLQDLAECLSDDLAVSASARPLGLARSLVDVASWTFGERPLLPVAASGALSVRSRLGHRVERLMDPARTVERPRRALLPAAAAVVLATALVTPGVSGSAAPPPAPPAQPAPAAQTAPPAPSAPKAEPATKAQPAPRAQSAPKAQPAPKADAVPRGEAEERLERLSRRIEERARLHDADMKALETEIEAIVSRIRPHEEDLQLLGRDMEKAAEDLAEAVSADLEAGAGRKSERTAEAARRMAEAEDRLRAVTREIRMPSEEIRALAEKARALAEQARPTDEEIREIHRLSADAARLGAEQARDAMQIAREALRQAREALRRGADGFQD